MVAEPQFLHTCAPMTRITHNSAALNQNLQILHTYQSPISYTSYPPYQPPMHFQHPQFQNPQTHPNHNQLWNQASFSSQPTPNTHTWNQNPWIDQGSVKEPEGIGVCPDPAMAIQTQLQHPTQNLPWNQDLSCNQPWNRAPSSNQPWIHPFQQDQKQDQSWNQHRSYNLQASSPEPAHTPPAHTSTELPKLTHSGHLFHSPVTSRKGLLQNASYFPTPFHLQQQQQQQQQSYVAPPAVQPVYPTTLIGPSTYSLPQYQQAQQLFQRDAQTITPEALESVKAALASSEIEHKAETKKKAVPRKAAGQAWEDPTLAEWPENDFRLFCGDLGNEVNDDVLSKAFSRFPSFNMAKVVRDKRTGKTKGYGFVSFANPTDLAGALKEMNGKYVGNRPIKLRKSNWKERTDYEALDRQKRHHHKKPKLSKKSILHK